MTKTWNDDKIFNENQKFTKKMMWVLFYGYLNFKVNLEFMGFKKIQPKIE